MKKQSVKNDLSFIAAHSGSFPSTIKKVETGSIPLTESTLLFETSLDELGKAPGPVGDRIRTKCEMVLSRNPDYNRVRELASILRGNSPARTKGEFGPSEVASSPITSTEVERTFSMLKATLGERRQNFTFENLRMIMIEQSNQ